MRTLLLLSIVVTSSLARAAEAEPAPRNWTVGAGLGVVWWPMGLSSLAGSTTAGGLLGVNTVQTSATALIERRLSARTFLLFTVSGGYGSWQNSSEVSSRQFNVEGQLGARYVFNPHGVVEVSWYGSARVGWQSYETKGPTLTVDPETGVLSADVVTARGRGLSGGAATGLVFERELLEGLALRFSSSVLGFNATTSSSESTGNFTVQSGSGGGFDVGLRFSPTLELRYAF